MIQVETLPTPIITWIPILCGLWGESGQRQVFVVVFLRYYISIFFGRTK